MTLVATSRKVLAAASLLATAGCGVVGLPNGRWANQAPLRIAIRQPFTLDPVLARDPAAVLVARQIFEPLVQFDPETLALEPAAASSWRAYDGGKRFVFKLRRGAKFHNGSPVEAEDVRYGLNRLASQDTRSDLAFLLESVEGFKEVNETTTAPELSGVLAPDASTVEIRLTSPWYEFPYVLTHPATAPLPRAQLQANASGFKEAPIGSGPYRLNGSAPRGTDVSLLRFEDYSRVKPPIEAARFLIYEPGKQWKDFEAGLVDVAEVPASRLRAGESKYGSRGFSPVAAGVYLGFNLARLPDLRLRQAVSMGLDRARIAHDVYSGVMSPASSLIPPGLTGHQQGSCSSLCRFDPTAVRSLLSLVFPAGENPPLGLDYQQGAAQDALAKALQAHLTAAGLTLSPRSYALPEFFKILDERRQNIFRIGWAADYPLADWFLSPLLHSSSQDNYTGLADPEIDRLISDARAESQPEKRNRLYRAIEKRAVAQAAVVPVGFLRNHWAAPSRIRGFYIDRIGGFQISRLSVAGR